MMPAPDRPTCRCGHDRYSHWTRADLRYGLGGWFMLFSGASAAPKKATFTCGRCGETFEVTRDPRVLRAFRSYPDMPADLP